MRIVVVTPPAELPVTLLEAKQWLRIEYDAEDALIARMLEVATDQVEALTKRALITQTLRLERDAWPPGRTLWLPRPPLVSVTYLKYKDAAGTLQTVDSSDYTVQTGGDIQGRCVVAFGQSWPTPAIEPAAVQATYVAGYGDAADVPQQIKTAILTATEHLVDTRGGAITQELRDDLLRRLGRYRVIEVIS